MNNFLGQRIAGIPEKRQTAGVATIGPKWGSAHDQRSLDTKDFGRVIIGGGYAGISSPKKLPLR
jgi:hypothetical protein